MSAESCFKYYFKFCMFNLNPMNHIYILTDDNWAKNPESRSSTLARKREKKKRFHVQTIQRVNTISFCSLASFVAARSTRRPGTRDPLKTSLVQAGDCLYSLIRDILIPNFTFQ